MMNNNNTEYVLKTCFKNDVRRVRIDISIFDFRELKQLVKKQFAIAIKKQGGLKMIYVDEDNDKITITNQEELEEAFRVSSRAKSLKIFVDFSSHDQAKTENSTIPGQGKGTQAADSSSFIEEKEGVHWGFTCDLSGQCPIRGPRFHKRGENFDLCREEFEKLSDEDKKLFERIDVPARGRFWRKMRKEKQGERGWRSQRGGRGAWKFWKWGGRGRENSNNVLFKKFKLCCKALKNCDENALLEALKSAEGAAKECVAPLHEIILAIREKTTMRVLRQLNRSPTMIKFKRMLDGLQEKIQEGQVTLFDAPGLILNSNEYAVAIAHLRDVLPKLAVAVEKIGGLLPRLAIQLPSILPRLLPVFALMAFGVGKTSSDQDEKKNKKGDKNYRSMFVKDANLHDGTRVCTGSKITKTWVIKNSGEHEWPKDTSLLHVGGDLELRAEESRVLIGSVKAGDEVSVSVNLTTPTTCGRAWSYWRLVYGSDAGSKRSGLKLWADLSVVESEVDGSELPEVPKNSTMIGTTAFGHDLDEEVRATEEKEEEKKEEEEQDAEFTMISALEALEKDDDEVVIPESVVVETSKQNADLGPWSGAVQMLEEMGFDPNRFRELLKRHNGDIQAIMSDMLK